MSNKKNKSTVSGVTPPASLAKPSKVIRDEQTYTTVRKNWPIVWKHGVYEKVGTRLVEVKKAIFIDLRRNVEFFPSKFLESLTPADTKGWKASELKVEELREFMEDYVAHTRHVDVMHFDRRPRPQSQIELEEELTEVYERDRQNQSIITQQGEEIDRLRAALKAKEKASA